MTLNSPITSTLSVNLKMPLQVPFVKILMAALARNQLEEGPLELERRLSAQELSSKLSISIIRRKRALLC